MPHPYPKHDPRVPYVGKYNYSLTFCTDTRRPIFADGDAVAEVRTQILRAANAHGYELTAYCFMPDHVHLIVRGLTDGSDLKAFVKSAKQLSGYEFKQRHESRLWQRYGYERAIRDDFELAFTIGYVIANPVRAGLAERPDDYPFVGSQRYTVQELIEICEYKDGMVYRETNLPPKGGSHESTG